MGLPAANPYGPHAQSTGRTAGSRGVPATVPVRATELADLHDEIHALHQERSWLGKELARLSQMVLRSVLHQSDDIAMEASGRLDYLSGRLIARGDGA